MGLHNNFSITFNERHVRDLLGLLLLCGRIVFILKIVYDPNYKYRLNYSKTTESRIEKRFIENLDPIFQTKTSAEILV